MPATSPSSISPAPPTGRMPFLALRRSSAPLTFNADNGINLTKAAHQRSTSNTLTISGLLTSDNGGYDVIVGTFTTRSRVMWPAVRLHSALVSVPRRTCRSSRSNAVLGFTPGGTPPFTFGWMKDNTPLTNGGRISAPTRRTSRSHSPTRMTRFCTAFPSRTSWLRHQRAAMLSVLMPPVITANNASGSRGFVYHYQAAATGFTPITFGRTDCPPADAGSRKRPSCRHSARVRRV